MNLYSSIFALVVSSVALQGTNCETLRRRTQQYYSIGQDVLGFQNKDVAIGNPMKGLMESPVYTWPPYKADIPLALEFYYIGLDEVMTGWNQYDWSVLDKSLEGSASRNMHAIFRVILHFPSQAPKVPKFLSDAGFDISDYGNPQLLKALEQFITSLGDRYDGDKRIAFIQAGLLGDWGEWHCSGCNFPTSTMERVSDWFAASFGKTKIQLRYPHKAFRTGFGLHDDSFAFQTLDGDSNGGVEKEWYFWPRTVSEGHADFWKKAPMGGETRGHLQEEVFEPWYNARSFERQDFMECVETTHTTYMFHHSAFKNGGFSGEELLNARHAHARMGYNYFVEAASAFSNGKTVDLTLTVEQTGVAPFYYPLDLVASCSGFEGSTSGVDILVDVNQRGDFTIRGLPATSKCLDDITISLRSPNLYDGRPIKFAQNDGTVNFRVPVPDATLSNSTPAPMGQSSPAPTTSKPNLPFTPSPTSISEMGCDSEDFQGQCVDTVGCQGLYSGATDCRNSLGGVCFCGSEVCGCRTTTPTLPTTSAQCFSGSMTVQVQGKGLVRMDELDIGDSVYVGNDSFSLVHGFYHIDRQTQSSFLSISTDRFADTLEITDNHLVFVNDSAVPAHSVQVGDKFGDATVTDIQVVKRRGVYSPATLAGTIVVNGILASTYTSQLTHSPVSEHMAVHVVLSYHRLICRFNLEWCKSETYSGDGLSNWNLPLIRLVRIIDQFGAPIQVAASVALLPMFALLFLVEQVIISPILALVGLGFLIRLLCSRRRKTKVKTM